MGITGETLEIIEDFLIDTYLMQIDMDARRVRPTFTILHVKTENSCEFVDLLYIVVYILDEIKFSFTEIFFY